CYDQRSPTIENCVFSGNTADAGGGMVNDTSDPKVFNCVFTGNSANYDGGAVMNMRDARPTITNCTVSGNTAASSCGGVYNWLGEGNEVNVANCILWGNSDDSGTDESAQIDVLEGTALVNYSSVQGCTIFCANPDDHNIGDDPLFVRDPDPGPDGNWDGVDDDYGDLHLQAGSPCIDAGNNNADTDANTPGIQPLPPTDLDGNFRIVMVESATVDMGAYEFQDGTPIPAVSEWGLVAMTLLVLTAGTVVLMRRRRAVTAC
ncbi:MAG: IPTL-CTERM sorting domain-containing protein, partial [Phycisphaerae bacterium]